MIVFGLSLFILFHSVVSSLSPAQLKGFDDSILFKINWPGKDGYKDQQMLKNMEELDQMVVMTHQKEKYRCLLPELKEKEKDSDDVYTGPNPIKLLSPVFQQSTCTSLLETYWTYELCHGRYIRQYHEEREGKKVKLQEYYLGRWDSTNTEKLSEQFDKDTLEGKPLNPPLKKLDGISLPYLQLNFTDGTICDLNGKPRRTSVLYVCFAGGKNDIFLIKETSTCEYEVLVISADLCKHPKYRPQVTGENEINCLPVGDAATKPESLVKMETEAFKQKHFSAFGDSKNDKIPIAVYSIDEYKDKDGKMQVRVEFRPLGDDELENELAPSPVDAGESPANPPAPPIPQSVPDVPFNVLDFIGGKACPEGGYGWWKYKFCYKGNVEQYHIDKKGTKSVKTSIILGTWDQEAHIKWLAKNPHKKPKPVTSRTFVSHFYSGGDICEETGKPRETEVKLRCVQNKGSVSIYLLEPQTCQYILGVESSIICEFIENVNEYGLDTVSLP